MHPNELHDLAQLAAFVNINMKDLAGKLTQDSARDNRIPVRRVSPEVLKGQVNVPSHSTVFIPPGTVPANIAPKNIEEILIPPVQPLAPSQAPSQVVSNEKQLEFSYAPTANADQFVILNKKYDAIIIRLMKIDEKLDQALERKRKRQPITEGI